MDLKSPLLIDENHLNETNHEVVSSSEIKPVDEETFNRTPDRYRLCGVCYEYYANSDFLALQCGHHFCIPDVS